MKFKQRRLSGLARYTKVNLEKLSDGKTAKRNKSLSETVKNYIYSVLGSLAEIVLGVLKKLASGIAHAAVKAGRLFLNCLKAASSKLEKPVSNAVSMALKPFTSRRDSAKRTVDECRAIKNEQGAKASRRFIMGKCSKLLFGENGILVTAFNYAAPVVAIAFLVGIVKYAGEVQYGVAVEVNGKSVGVVDDETVYNDAQKLMQNRISYAEGDETVTVPLKFAVQRIAGGGDVISTNELADIMLSSSDVSVSEAFGLYINGECTAAYTAEDKERIESALAAILENYKQGLPGEVVEFVDTFEFKEGLYINDKIVSADEFLASISGTETIEPVYYTVQNGDVPLTIADKNGITYEQLVSLNPTIEDSLMVGEQVVLTNQKAEKPALDIKRTYIDEYEATVEATVIEVQDSTKYQGVETIISSGSDGYSSFTARVTEINGVETERQILKETVIEQMVPRKISVGTLENPTTEEAIYTNAGTFVWPVGGSGGYISSLFGYREWDNSNHMALDIAGIPSGTPVYAAADGYVTVSESHGSYGKMIIIDHGNGYETVYAHNSKLLAAVGDYVKKGDTVALIGMTGSASGNHLHFEVRYNGVKYDPLKFLGGTGGREIRE